jgi:iron complex outermembrane recepter protein
MAVWLDGEPWELPIPGLQATQVVKRGFKSLPSVARIECVGLNGPDCGGPTPKIKYSQRATWTMGDFTAGYNWRYLGKSNVQGAPATLPQFASIKAYNYIDLNFAWQATKNLRMSLAINNASDLDPPVLGANVGTTTTNSGNTFPQWYDVIGRQFSLGATLKF